MSDPLPAARPDSQALQDIRDRWDWKVAPSVHKRVWSCWPQCGQDAIAEQAKADTDFLLAALRAALASGPPPGCSHEVGVPYCGVPGCYGFGRANYEKGWRFRDGEFRPPPAEPSEKANETWTLAVEDCAKEILRLSGHWVPHFAQPPYALFDRAFLDKSAGVALADYLRARCRADGPAGPEPSERETFGIDAWMRGCRCPVDPSGYAMIYPDCPIHGELLRSAVAARAGQATGLGAPPQEQP